MSFSLVDIWNSMGLLAKSVFFVLVIMSLWSLYVFFDRYFLYRSAKKQSLQFIGKVGGPLKQNNMQECVNLAKKFKKSHIAKVFSAGLLEFQAEKADEANYNIIAASRRAIERATVKTGSEMKRGLGGLATIGATAPFVGLFGTVAGIIKAFQGMAATNSGGIGAVAAGIAEALVTTAMGLFVAIPAVWFYNYLLNKSDLLSVEMSNSSSELIDHFIKVTGGQE
jgi:biopolymer transport protein ExbB